MLEVINMKKMQKKSKKCTLIKIREAQAGAFRFLSYRGQKLKTNAFHE